MKKKCLVMTALAAAAAVLAAGCGIPQKDTTKFKVATITDTGGVNDQAFNQLAWEGLQEFGEETGAEVSYLESKQASDYFTNLDRATDGFNDLIWGTGFAMADSIVTVAKMNPDISFALIDNEIKDAPFNVTSVTFRAAEPSFLVGYIAGKTTETDKVGYVGAVRTETSMQFEYGYAAGVAYAAQELGKEIQVSVQLTESYADAAKAKAVAGKMYSSGCDVIFHAAGGAGYGVIESAKEWGKYVIGVDKDQSYLAPDNVLTSALKNVNVAIGIVSKMAMDGEEIGGKTLDYGLEEGCVGIPEENPNLDPQVQEDTMKLKEIIQSGEIVPPANEEEYQSFISERGLYDGKQ
ncbi:MAG: BMP family ABC transporter substrate-binding protein [Eubacteriales bacterium]|nr:BMP family ABC transporter substrate-binding protein [Eubacteriales bacterium]